MSTAILVATFVATTAGAQDALPSPSSSSEGTIREAGNFGIGLQSGSLAGGLTGRYFVRDTQVVQVGLGAGYSGTSYGAISGAYLFEMPVFYEHRRFNLGWYVGPGALVATSFGVGILGIHAAVGLEMDFKNVPVDVSFQYNPGLVVVTGLGVAPSVLDMGLAMRMYF
jgi:hypothetical protein